MDSLVTRQSVLRTLKWLPDLGLSSEMFKTRIASESRRVPLKT